MTLNVNTASIFHYTVAAQKLNSTHFSLGVVGISLDANLVTQYNTKRIRHCHGFIFVSCKTEFKKIVRGYTLEESKCIKRWCN